MLFRSNVKVLTAVDHTSNSQFKLTFDKLILSPGAAPVRPAIPGIERALSLRTVEDVLVLADSVNKKPKSAVIIGGGFIGLELAENFQHRGISTSIVEASEQVLAPLDPEMVTFVQDELTKQGVSLYLKNAVTEIKDSTLILNDGREISAEVVVAAIGVKPEITLAKSAGLKIGSKGGIEVNEFNQTSDPEIGRAHV